MTKALKRFLLICLSVVTFAFVGAAVACGETQPQKVTYTVEVVDEDNTAVVGANVIFCKDGQCDTPVVTGTDGKVSVEKDAGVYEVHATAPTGSDLVDSETKLTLSKAENQTIKLTLEVEKSEYTVMVYNEDEEAVAGATVKFYAIDPENPPMSEPPVSYTGTTDANGIVAVELPSSYYIAMVSAEGCEENMTYLYPYSDTGAVILSYTEGSENAPYSFYGSETYEVNGTAYFEFSAYNANTYYFTVSSGTINVGTSSAATYAWTVSPTEIEEAQTTEGDDYDGVQLPFSVTTTEDEVDVYLAMLSGEGTDTDPLVISGDMMGNNAGLGTVPVTVAANSVLYVSLPGWNGSYIVSCASNALTYKLSPMMPMGQAFPTSAIQAGNMFMICNDTTEDVQTTISVAVAVGTMDNPGKLVEGVNTFTFDGSNPYVVAYSATEDVTITLTEISATGDGVHANLLIVDYYSSELVYDGLGGEYNQTVFTVGAYETLFLGVAADAWSATDVTFTVTITPGIAA